jgi:hypothetical protein
LLGREDALCHGRIVFRNVSAIFTSYQSATIDTTHMHYYVKIKNRQHALLQDREGMIVYGMDDSFFLLSQHLEYHLRAIEPKYYARSTQILCFLDAN